jgi:hypothetical protein
MGHVLQQLGMVGQAGGQIGGIGLARRLLDALALHRQPQPPAQGLEPECAAVEHVLRTALQKLQRRADRGLGRRHHQGGLQHRLGQARPTQQAFQRVGVGRADEDGVRR